MSLFLLLGQAAVSSWERFFFLKADRFIAKWCSVISRLLFEKFKINNTAL